MALSSREKSQFRKKFLGISSYFCTHLETQLLKILRGMDAWTVSPPQISEGPSPQSLYVSAMILIIIIIIIIIIINNINTTTTSSSPTLGLFFIVYLSVCQSVCQNLGVSLRIYLSVRSSVYLSISLSVGPV